jgi:ligand-binding SRPBCC domain-containing protein
VPIAWLTDIAEWNPPTLFVDNQLKGPYSLWYHEHSFEVVKGGTLLKDWVRYRLPMGKLGSLMGLGKVRSDVSKIFAYRKEVILQRFGG